MYPIGTRIFVNSPASFAGPELLQAERASASPSMIKMNFFNIVSPYCSVIASEPIGRAKQSPSQCLKLLRRDFDA
jgi:hypothetical protein